jgi:hypothetical protein
MSLDGAENADGWCEARTFCKVTRRMAIPRGSTFFEGEIDHRAQQQRCGEWVFGSKRVSSRGQDFIMIAV